MLTCIVVAHKRFEHYHFHDVQKHNIRLVLVLPRYAVKIFDKSIENCIDKIYYLKKIDFYSLSSVLQIELTIQPDKDYIRILCNDEIFLMDIGKIRKEFSIQGIWDSDYLRFRDKILMKEILKKRGIRVPKFCQVSLNDLRLDPEKKYQELRYSFNGTFFVKPTFGSSAINAFKITSYVEFYHWISLQSVDDSHNCEEYIEGTLYLCDSFIDNGEVIFSEVCEYSYPCLEYDKGLPLGIIPLHDDDIIRKEIIAFAEQVHIALQACNGGTHLEVFRVDNGEIIFVEIGARPGGAGVPKILEKNYGFNTYEQTLKQVLNIPISKKQQNNTFYAEVFWAQKLGKVAELVNPQLECSINIEWFIKIGDEFLTKAVGTVTPIAVKMYLTSHNYKTLYDSFIELRTFQPVRYHLPYIA